MAAVADAWCHIGGTCGLWQKPSVLCMAVALPCCNCGRRNHSKGSSTELFASKALCLEDIEVGQFDETMLFHALNLARQEGGHVLLSSRLEPAQWQVKLPDLASRLKALPVVHILPPDDALLRAVLVKQFADRQIVVDEALIGYMILRMPRSAAAARALVAEIDRQAMVERAEITRPFVAKVMARVESPDLFTT